MDFLFLKLTKMILFFPNFSRHRPMMDEKPLLSCFLTCRWYFCTFFVVCFLLQGSFAEVRVYSLGVFAVVSCLKRESYTVSPKGLSLKLPMDPRVCLSYLPGSFATPVMAQTMVHTLHCDRLTTGISSSGFLILTKKYVFKKI